MKSIYYLLSLSVICLAVANGLTQTPKTFQIAPGSGMWYLEYLPPTYVANPTSNSQRSPVIIFLHGAGENGSGKQADLEKLKGAYGSLPYLINSNIWPTTQPFIVLSPQTWGWWDSPKVIPLINQIGTLYPGADTTRVYLTGLSQGGAGVVDTIRQNKAVCDKLAAAIPICPAQAFATNDWQWPVASGLPVWFFHNNPDPQVSVWNSRNWVNGLNAQNICPVAKLTEYGVNPASHDSWTVTYNNFNPTSPNNIYNWLLSYTNVRTSCGTTTTIASATTISTTGTPSTTVVTSTTAATTASPATTVSTSTTGTTSSPATTIGTSTTTGTTSSPSTTIGTSTTTGTPAIGVFQKKWTTPTNPFGFWEYRPSFVGSAGYPLIIHLHGSDGEGNGSSTDLNKAALSSLPNYIRTGNWPSSYPFLVLAPQTNQGVWDNVNTVLTTLLNLYSGEVDPTRIYLVGQGRGAAGIVNYLKSNATRIDQTAAIFCVRVYTNPHNATLDLMVNDHLPTWWTTNNDDPNSDPQYTKNFVSWLNARGANPAPILTLNPSGGADSYTAAFNPANPPASNAYSWLLSKTNVR